MARNTYKEKKTSSQKRPWFPWTSFFADKRLVIAIGILLQGISVFLLFAFISHLFHSKADQGAIEAAQELGVRVASAKIQNWLGLLGAISAYYCMFRWFGITAFLLLPPLYLLGHRCVYARPWGHISLYKTTIIACFGVLWGNTALGYAEVVLNSPTSWIEDLVGGAGIELGILFNGLLGGGTVIVLLVTLLIFLVYFFNITALPRPFATKLQPAAPPKVAAEASDAPEDCPAPSPIVLQAAPAEI
ncbi:MAG: hypothetical protein AAFQ08_01740, partial [Bacteroidota bacterium]